MGTGDPAGGRLARREAAQVCFGARDAAAVCRLGVRVLCWRGRARADGVMMLGMRNDVVRMCARAACCSGGGGGVVCRGRAAGGRLLSARLLLPARGPEEGVSASCPLLQCAPACLGAGTLTCLHSLHVQTLKDVKVVAQEEKVRVLRPRQWGGE